MREARDTGTTGPAAGAAPVGAPVRTVRAGAAWAWPDAAELWAARDLLLLLVARDFKIRFKQSLLGAGWAVLQPAAMTLVFSVVLMRAPGLGFDGPYPLFFLAGLTGWNCFAKVFSGSTASLVAEGELIRKVWFPRLILPLAQAAAALTDLLVALGVFLALCLWYRWPLSAHLLALPLFAGLALAWGLAWGLWLGPLNVRFRDVQIVLPLLQQLLFVLTPVMYPLRLVWDGSASGWGLLYALNPAVGMVEGFRWCLLGQGDPFRSVHLASWGLVLALLAGGLAVFGASQKRFADVL